MKALLNFMVILIISGTAPLFGQDVSKYFDDSGISNYNKILKAGLDPLNFELSLSLERQVISNISVEFGTNFISSARQAKVYDFPYDLHFSGEGIGVSFWAGFKLYQKGFPERLYYNFQPRITFMSGHRFTDIVFANIGYQWLLNGKLAIDASAGLGVRAYSYTYTAGAISMKEKDSNFYFPLQIKLGYAFK